jgi:hypothetical protein
MIGLVGIVSGLLAKDMIAALEEKGHGLFKPEEDKQRTLDSVQTGRTTGGGAITDTTSAASKNAPPRAAA